VSLALDTNVLVRFLVRDDEEQHRQARSLIDGAIADGETFFVSEIVLCEVVWVLDTSYRVSKPEIVQALRTLVRAKLLHWRAADRARAAVDAFAQGRGDFADYLIREDGRAAGATALVTFDRHLLKESGFRSP
jgi:predicted nucleic-acid-binding protein